MKNVTLTMSRTALFFIGNIKETLKITSKRKANNANHFLQTMKSNWIIKIGAFASAITCSIVPTYAEDQEPPTSGTDSIDTFIDFVADWLLKIGGVVALIGGVMFALSWQREDSEGKSKAALTLMAGFMLMAIAKTPSLFNL